ncbi:MAG: hypothetical protein GXO88_08960, partial [Chlorobi bacterium]|nr:hypothetical protein [Chlorobiota bacterium]
QSIVIDETCFHHFQTWCHVHYDSTNIDADPNFLGMWDHPYMISDNSPCIDAGTLANLPDFIQMPEYDLAGNPRVVGDSIDMGAYEWNSTIVGFHNIGPESKTEKKSLLKASPNPFDWGTYVEIEEKAKIGNGFRLEVYDNYGRFVRQIILPGLPQNKKALWYGDDKNGKPLPTGVYNIVMFECDKEVGNLKVVKK